MSVTFRDGPAGCVELELQRAPMLLRVVVDTRAEEAELPLRMMIDALDLLDDEPRPTERVEVYELVHSLWPVHVCGRGFGGWIVTATYRHRPDVDAEALELGDTERWRAWANREGGRLLEVRAEERGAAALHRRRGEPEPGPERAQDADVVAHPTRPPDPPPPATPIDELGRRRALDD